MSSNQNFAQNHAAFYVQYTGTPTQGHEEFIQNLTSPEQFVPSSKPLINPNFKQPNVHINPRFSQTQESGPKIAINPNFAGGGGGAVRVNPRFKPSPPASPKKEASIHINPRFANRPLPSVPVCYPHPSALNKPPASLPSIPEPTYANRPPTVPPPSIHHEPIYANVNPGVSLDHKKTDDFVQSIEQTLQSQVVMRNKYKKDNRSKPPEKPVRHSIIEKPNRYSIIVEKPKRNSVYVVQNTPTNFSTTTPFQTPARKIEEKENVPSSSKKSFLFTPLRKTPFKKIGSRKLVRVKKKSLSPGTPKPSFKRIGNNKLIRIRESLTSDISTPLKIYKIKTKTKIVKSVKNTPTNNSKYRFSFITPLSMRKNKLVSQTFGSSKPHHSGEKKPSFANRFRFDRRREKKDKPSMIKKTSTTRLRKLSGSTYRVSATKLQRVVPVKPTRTRNVPIYRPKAAVLNPNLAPNRLITVQGVKFAVAENGRKLKRVSESESGNYSASVSHTSPGQSQTTSPGLVNTSPGAQTSPATNTSSPSKYKIFPSPLRSSPKAKCAKKTYIGGEEFDEIEPGVFTRSRHSLTRQSITHAKNRSINTILKVQNRSKQYCMFYNKFGKCTKKEKGSCPYIHDPEKIAVCRRFLQGACTKEKCLLSHNLAPEKMPACKFFLEGVCTRENCPYLHVKVNDKAGVCQRFLKGFCPNGADCGQRHVIACPEFDRTGACSKDTKCPFPHIHRTSTDKDEDDRPKRRAPVKPKRKSLGQNETTLKKSRVTSRYYDEPSAADGVEETPTLQTQVKEQDPLEEKRKRILKKIELSKKVWQAGISEEATQAGAESATMEAADTSLNDSGPYEKIEEEEPQRPPIGTLGDFISLNGDENKQDRLI